MYELQYKENIVKRLTMSEINRESINPGQLRTYMELGRAPKMDDVVEIVKIGSTAGMLIVDKHLNVRREGVSGIVKGYVPGHGGDVWWVWHGDSSEVGAYTIDAMAPYDLEARMRQRYSASDIDDVE